MLKFYKYIVVNSSVKVCNICITLKKNMFGCFTIEEIRDKDNETGLKEKGVIEMSTTVLPLRDARSLSIFVFYLPTQ